ncbi:MAG: HD domain-containing protein, partial [Bacteroidetes bacterium]|nr:HD domain-containing protein [Bacteroidota bacterium]
MIPHHLPEPLYNALYGLACERKQECYLVGGYVRDILLQRPVKDVDILVVGGGIEFAHELAKRLPGVPQVHFYGQYGTAMLHTHDFDVEFVGARKESYRADSRKPLVEDGSLEDDLNRRDFTINALAMQIWPVPGKLIDQHGGVKHLNEGVIVTPSQPELTFSDDPLRMLRAIRFASQLGFKIEEKTLQGIRTSAHRIDIISAERISDELNKIIQSARPDVGFDLLMDTGLLERFFPEMAALRGVEVVQGMGHKDNFYHTLEVLDNICLKTDKLWLRWAAILHDIAKPATKRFEEGHGWTFHGHEVVGGRMVPKIFAALKLPLNDKMKFVRKLVELHLRPISLTKENITDSAVRRLLFDAGDDFESLMMLCEADITSKNKQKVKRFLDNFLWVRQRCREVEEKDH